MALYAGETTRIKSTGLDFDGTSLTNLNVNIASVVIKNKLDSTTVATANMAWDTTHAYWYYDWDTTSVDSGAYRAKVTFTGAGFSTWEYIDIRLKANP